MKDSLQKTLIVDEIFRAYDIRGVVGPKLNPHTIYLIGKAIGSEALDLQITSLALAADARISSPSFSTAMARGILSTGCNVIDLGVVPTPLMYFATHTLSTDSGVMITGSHNPKEYNGVKVVLQQNCLVDNQISNLKQRILDNNLRSGNGVHTHLDLRQNYISRIIQDITLKRQFKVVIDCGNGVTGNVAPLLFESLGCHVFPLFCNLDGNFPNHHPDPTVAANLAALIQKVKCLNADLGIAFDGDGDRVALVCQSGEIFNADKLMLAFIKDILPNNPDSNIVFDVKSSQHLSRTITAYGGNPIMSKSGHSYVKQAMLRSKALLGGEYSAHIFFKHRWYGFDDGQYTAARFLELMDKNNSTADDILQQLPTFYCSDELSIPISDQKKFNVMQDLIKNIQFPNATISNLDGIKATFSDSWGLLRASNTTPNLVLRFEADSESGLKRVIKTFKHEIMRLQPSLTINF